MNEKYDYVVVGAGFAGSIVAQQLHEAGKKVLVVERRDHIAGNAFDEVDEHGILRARYGPHVFNANSDEIVKYLSRFTDWRPYEHRVLAQTRRGLVPMPVNIVTLERWFGRRKLTKGQAEKLLAEVREPIEKPKTVEESVLAQIGAELYRALFLGYTTKQWGRSPGELDVSVVGRLPVRLNRDDRYFTSKFQAQPAAGYTAMFERILEGIEVWTGFDVSRDSSDELLLNAKHLVWTGPIDEAFDCRFGRLPWRSLEFRHELIRSRELVQPVGVINYPSGLVGQTRTTEWRHLTVQDSDVTVVTHEYPAAEGDPYYPVPTPDSKELYGRYAKLASETPNVTFVGRLARYQYLSMHQVVGQALKAARDLLA